VPYPSTLSYVDIGLLLLTYLIRRFKNTSLDDDDTTLYHVDYQSTPETAAFGTGVWLYMYLWETVQLLKGPSARFQHKECKANILSESSHEWNSHLKRPQRGLPGRKIKLGL